MTEEELYNQIQDAVIELEEDASIKLAKRAISENFSILRVIENGYGIAVRKLGDLWNDGEIFLPELILGGKIVERSIDLLLPHLKKGEKLESKGKIILATIEGDIHSIGKTIVGSLLKANGFDVYDLGADVPAERIVDEATKVGADIIGVSALLTSTMVGQKKVIQILNQRNLTDFKVILGGAPVTKRWVEECDADGYAENAIDAVELVKALLS